MKENIYVDTDMFLDDVMAIAMLLASRGITISCISTVTGMASAQNGVLNMQRLAAWVDRNDIPIIAGADTALQQKGLAISENIRERANTLGELDDLNIPSRDSAQTNNFKTVEELIVSDKRITILCLGPLTNIAGLIKKYPEKMKKNIQRLVIMGGVINAIEELALGRFAEFNMRADPEAAEIVFKSTLPITLISLDATQFVPATITDAKRKNIFSFETFYRAVQESNPQDNSRRLIRQVILTNNDAYNCFYDQLAAAIIIDPTIITSNYTTTISVDLNGMTRGATKASGTTGNITVVDGINTEKFYKLILKLLDTDTRTV